MSKPGSKSFAFIILNVLLLFVSLIGESLCVVAYLDHPVAQHWYAGIVPEALFVVSSLLGIFHTIVLKEAVRLATLLFTLLSLFVGIPVWYVFEIQRQTHELPQGLGFQMNWIFIGLQGLILLATLTCFPRKGSFIMRAA